MLSHLVIQDLAIIEHAELDFAPGLNVVTGETGAGKSIVMEALKLILGCRARSESIRHGRPCAEIQAQFQIPLAGEVATRLRAMDLLSGPRPGEVADVIVRRVVSRAGRSRATINGVLVNMGLLAEATQGLVDLTGQHEQTMLTGERVQRDVLDRFGGLWDDRMAYETTWEALQEAVKNEGALIHRQQERLQREDYLRYQLEELLRVAPAAGEETDLRQERARLAHAVEIVQGARAAEHGLRGHEGSVHDLLAVLTRSLESLRGVEPGLAVLAKRLESARIELDDVAHELWRVADEIASDPARLDEVEQRLDSLHRLARKHGVDPAGLWTRTEAIQAELTDLEQLEDELGETRDARACLEEAARRQASELSTSRRLAAQTLEAAVEIELRALDMEGAALLWRVESGETLGPFGLDRVGLDIRTNPGEPAAPLARIASGGELSRLLLALKGVLATTDAVPTAVFDEVDSGVGGDVGEAIGQKLLQIGHARQVIAITHLPQIAAQADHHLKVQKAVRSGRTTAAARVLRGTERAAELARMLGGKRVTLRARQHAEELLARHFPRAA